SRLGAAVVMLLLAFFFSFSDFLMSIGIFYVFNSLFELYQLRVIFVCVLGDVRHLTNFTFL
ncbi:hypothetical protein, partial [Klebsiella pneumoniae]|uniref:hypothetical protein n=1 Tax=Klebsiella pneumoniae TaxID=573 RepID=UPI00272FE095